MTKPLPKRTALAQRIAENRRGAALSPEDDAALLEEYLSDEKPSLRELAERHGYGVGTVSRAVKRAAEVEA